MKEEKPKNKAKPKKKKKVGRKPYSYKALILDNLEDIERELSNGATEKSIYQSLGMGHSKWDDFKQKKELQEAIKRSKARVVQSITGAMYKRAVGHTVQEVTTTNDGRNEVVTVKEKYVYSDTSAIALLKMKDDTALDKLNNNDIKREELEEKKRANREVEGLQKELNNAFSNLTTEDLEKIVKGD